MKLLFIIIWVVFAWYVPSEDEFQMSKPARKKMEAALKSVFRSQDLSLSPVITEITGIPADAAPTAYEVKIDDELKGYVLFGKARGRTEKFDYMVIYSADLIIEQVEILEYRSDRGVEITNKRWLAQFKGSDGCGLEYGKDIDAIAGATLSGRALVNSITVTCDKIKMISTFGIPKP
ncbi:MAG: FMN-binding protein [Bacteroidales bacterium]|nr:FMN-binding protein [Bacteroidales bacterium]